MLIHFYEKQKLLHSKTQKTQKFNKSFFRNEILSGYMVKNVPEPYIFYCISLLSSDTIKKSTKLIFFKGREGNILFVTKSKITHKFALKIKMWTWKFTTSFISCKGLSVCQHKLFNNFTFCTVREITELTNLWTASQNGKQNYHT